jgi:AraC-like DNA-binding protein
VEIVSYIALTQVIFAIILVASKRPISLPDKILILILFDLSWIIVGSIFRAATLGGSIFSKLSLSPFILLLLPFIYLYVKKSIAEQPSVNRNEIKHFIIPLLLVLAGIYYNPLYRLENEMHNNPRLEVGIIVYLLVSVLYVVYYMYIIYQQIRLHQKSIPDHFSYVSSKITLNWVKIVLILFIVNWLMTGIVISLNIYQEQQVINAGMVFFINIALFSFAISYFGFLQPTIFQSIKQPEAAGQAKVVKPDDRASKQKYQKSTLSEEQAKKYLEKVNQLLNSERIYLNPELTIQNVSEKLDIPKHHLTESLNTYMGKSFYTLINEYRIDSFKKMAADKNNKHLTLLALAYDSGFNSKSSFNMVFKNYTGLTPSQYMKSIS